jgi:alpha-ketoglutarate-dependent taurine dioxygenase
MSKVEPLILNKIPSVDKLKQLVYEHTIVIIKNVKFKKHSTMVNFCEKFGKIQDHQGKLLVLSNDKNIGDPVNGSRGWHIDGLYGKLPSQFTFQYILDCPKNMCGTQFIKSDEVIKDLPKKYHDYYVVTKRSYATHPLIAKHHITGKEYLVLNRLAIENIVELQHRKRSSISKRYNELQTKKILAEIERVVEKKRDLIYVAGYEPGDLLIRDNFPLLHRSHPTAQISADNVGLREMWRVVVEGVHKPTK